MTFFQKFKNWFTRPEPDALPTGQEETVVKVNETPMPMNSNKLSKNFKLSEITKSQTASRKKIDNSPSPEHLENIKALVKEFLQPLRDQLGLPIIISSGYRSFALNRAIGGATDSQHSKGEAVDIECIGMSNVELANYIKDNCDFDQLILEFYNPDEGENSGWVHVSFKSDGSNRKEVLSALTDGTNTRYVYGIVTE